MTNYEKIISLGPDALAKLFTDLCCETAAKARLDWFGETICIPESLREDTLEHYRKILTSDYEEEN
jgi:hypothetical protein